MNKIPAVLILLCVTALQMAAQTKVLVAKSRVPISVAGDYHGGIAFPTACDEQGRLYVKACQDRSGNDGPPFQVVEQRRRRDGVRYFGCSDQSLRSAA